MFMQQHIRKAVLLSIIIALLTLLIPACSVSSPAPVAAPNQAPTSPVSAPTLSPTPTTAPPTMTPLPSATLTPTSTIAAPTVTPVPPLAVTQDGFNAWCIPETVLVSTDEAAKPWVMPAKARVIAMVTQKSTLYYNASSCVFELAFNQPAQSGMQLEFYDTLAKAAVPWLKVDMAISPDKPNMVYAVVTHGMVTKPPRWFVLYSIAIRSADGKEQFRQDIRFMRSWQLPPCWNTTLPDPVTLDCPKTSWGDIHPSNPGYGLYSKLGPSSTPSK